MRKFFESAGTWSLLPLRVSVGLLFLFHGTQKLFQFTPPGIAKMVEGLGFQPPLLWAWLLILAEFGGGILLIFGLATRFAALSISIAMLVAMAKVHWGHGFFAQEQGIEFPWVLCASMATLFFAGGGAGSLDALFSRKGNDQ